MGQEIPQNHEKEAVKERKEKERGWGNQRKKRREK